MRSHVSRSKSSVPLVFAAAVIASVAGCGSDSPKVIGDPDASTRDSRDAAMVDVAPSVDGGASLDLSESQEAGQAQDVGAPSVSYCTDKTALPSVTTVSGTWVIRALASQQVQALGTTLHPQTLFYILATMTQSGSTVVADGTYCDRAEIDQPGSLVRVIVPDKWAHTEKVMKRSGTLAVGAGGIPVLAFPPLVELAGAVPGPDTDQLPTTADDPRVVDEDLDGNPGITINVTGVVSGSIYSVQRQVTSVAAIPVAADRFEGALTFVSEQKILASNPSSLLPLYSSATAYSETTPCASTFAMVKVAEVGAAGGAGLDCAWVRSNEAALFPQ
jgi:hypothetical protein